MPSSASRCSAPSASRSLAQQIAVNGGAAGEQRVDGVDAGRRVEAGRQDEPVVRARSPRPPGRAGTRPAARARRTATPARRGTRSAGARGPTSAATIDATPASLSTPTSGSPAACGERWTTAAPSARIAARWRSISSFAAGSSRPEPGEHDGRRPDRAQQPDVRPLAVGVALGAAGDHEVAGGRRPVLDPAHDLREVRVGDVVDHDRHDRHVALEQAAGERVGDVVERPGRLEDARPRRRADRVVGRGDDARRGGRRHAGEARDLGDGRHAAAQ